MKAVFLDLKSFINNISLAAIEAQVTDLTCYDVTPPELVVERSINAEVIITNKVVLNRDVMSKLPHLKLICVAATGTNNIDIPAANALGIEVMNVSGYSTNSVSQYVFAQLLEFYSSTNESIQRVRQGQWQQSPLFCVHSSKFDELAGKTIGIVGYGDIGKNIANIAQAFGMNVIIAERANETKIRAGRVSFNEVLKTADIVSLHCPHTPETEHLFSHEQFANMQPHAIIINTARGAIIDNSALLSALNNKTIAGAILDVLEQEPPPADHILLKPQPENLFITAHIAWASSQAQQKLLNLIGENIKQFKTSK